jgi:hypothetical protein
MGPRICLHLSSGTRLEKLAGVLGLEPRLAAPEAAVLPLDDTPTPLFERQRLTSRLDAPPEATLKILERFRSVNQIRA